MQHRSPRLFTWGGRHIQSLPGFVHRA